ncbi:heavy metal-associated isoprenylated plant protein 35-like [Bidens hawaiensis]|uniref:heavy metal-associated isoprenylated plant protein 35-like n=1 Tax=Bidens hawaiensis TaxID=980011 RepID=UPI00404A5487
MDAPPPQPPQQQQQQQPPPQHEENSTPVLTYKTWVLKVSIHCVGCKRKVKKVLQTIEGVYTIDIDSKQHKVTVVGNVEVETLVKKLIKTRKHAEKWPENPGRTENTAAPGNNKGAESSDEEENNNNNNNPTNGGPSVKFAGVPENNQVPAGGKMGGGGGGGGGGGKKKKKKKKKKSSGAKAPGGPADTGLVPQEPGPTQVVDQVHLSSPHGYSHPMPGGPGYAVSYNAAHPGGNSGPAYYIPPTPYMYDYYEDDDDYATSSRPSDSFDILSDENPIGCYIM